MATFAYQAIDQAGRTLRGSIEAPSQEDALIALQRQGFTVLSVTQAETKTALKGKAKRKLHSGINGEDLVLYARQLATLIAAGVALSRALHILSMQIESKRLLAINEEVIKDVEGGKTLRDAFAKHSRVFSRFWVNLIETGEKSGQLATILDTLAAYLEDAASLKRKILTAMMYPIVLMLVVIGVTIFFITFVIPTFTKIYASMGLSAKLPFITKMFMGISDLVRRFILVVIGAFFLGGFLLSRYVQTEAGRMRLDSLMLRLPIMGSLFRSTATDSFTTSLSTLIKSGVPLLNALEILERTLDNRAIAAMLTNVKESVKGGKPMAEEVAKIDAFPPMVAQMIAVGEETGELARMLERVAKFAKERTDAFVARLTTVLEPILIVIMAVIIGTMAIAMYLPMFQFVATMQ